MTAPAQHPPQSPGARIVKRYANRKLYDTRDSRYVTLQQIAAYVRGGEDVTIIDNTTKEDLTNVTLAQIVYEEERKNGAEVARAPTGGTLRNLIQQSGERIMSTFRDIPVTKFIARREPPASETTAEAEEPTRPAKQPEERRLLMSPKEAWDELQRLADDRMKAVLGTAITHVQQLQAEVRRLQGRIEELEQRLVAMSAREPASKDERDSD